MSRRKYTREFKISAVKLVNEQGYSAPQAAKSLGVDPNCVRGWVARFSTEAGLAPGGQGALAAENRRLRQENARLTMEREILKKRRRSLPGSRCEVRLHPKASDAVSGGDVLPRAGGQPFGLLRLAGPRVQRAGQTAGGTGGEDQGGARGQPMCLWKSTSVSGAEIPGRKRL